MASMMPVPTVQVTVNAFDQDGSAMVAATVKAELIGTDVYNNQIIGKLIVEQATDAAGQAVLALFPNEIGTKRTYYRFTVTNADGKKIIDTTAIVPNVACNLAAIAGNLAQELTAPAVAAQPYSAMLTSLASVVSAADKLPYLSGVNTFALADFTAAGRSLVAAASLAAASALLPGPFLAADGSAAAPAYSFSADTDNGFYRTGTNSVAYASNGAAQILFADAFINMRSVTTLSWTSGDPSISSADLTLLRDAANTLAQRNGTSAQAFRLYNTYTDAANYERGELVWGANQFFIRAMAAGTGTKRDLFLDGFNTYLASNGTNRWVVTSAGNFAAQADNTYDIGTSEASRPRTGYFGTSVITPIVGSGAASGISLTTSGGTQFVIGHAASVVNYIEAKGGATGAKPNFLAQGSDASIGIGYFSKGAGGHEFYTDASVLQFYVAHTALAVNYLQITGGATGSTPSVSVQGTDVNISLDIMSKGSSGIGLFTNGAAPARQLQIQHTASAVNYWNFTGAATGNDLVVQATGPDTNIGMQYYSKGTSAHRFFTNLLSEQFRITHVASAVNYLNVYGAATAGRPVIEATGGDSNVEMGIYGKGTGAIILNDNFVVNRTASAVNYGFVSGGATGNPVVIGASGSDGTISLVHRAIGAAALHFFDSGGVVHFSTQGTASGVNYIGVSARETGSGPILMALGSDTNVNLEIRPQGTGDIVLDPNHSGANVRMGAHSAIVAETVTGFLTMKDTGGTVRKVAVVS